MYPHRSEEDSPNLFYLQIYNRQYEGNLQDYTGHSPPNFAYICIVKQKKITNLGPFLCKFAIFNMYKISKNTIASGRTFPRAPTRSSHYRLVHQPLGGHSHPVASLLLSLPPPRFLTNSLAVLKQTFCCKYLLLCGVGGVTTHRT